MPLRNYPSPDAPDGRPHQEQTAGSGSRSDGWEQFSNIFRAANHPLPEPWGGLFGPLRAGAVDDLVVVGQIGQSLDGRIATESGHSKYINGAAGLAHLHRLRALVDAVVVGVGTAGAAGSSSPADSMGSSPASAVLAGGAAGSSVLAGGAGGSSVLAGGAAERSVLAGGVGGVWGAV